MEFTPNANPTAAPRIPRRRPRVSRNQLIKGAVALILLIGLGWLIMSYIQTRSELEKLSTNPQAASEDEATALVNKISAYLTLPDEKPTLATVNDVSKLSGQEFFANAQNGDKVLIFASADRALLYRPSTEKVIEYSKVDLSTAEAQ